jgi:DNA polymerase
LSFDVPFRTDWAVRLAPAIARWRAYFAVHGVKQATIDFETRSACDIKLGAYVYSRHETTSVLCLAYLLPGMDEPGLWHCAHEACLIDQSDVPEDLLAFVLAGGLLEAHNAFFERCIWTNRMVPDYGWPEVPSKSWRCSAAKASAMSVPRDLDGAAQAVGLHVLKDKAGRATMLRVSKPRRVKGPDGLTRLEFRDDEDDIVATWEYCRQDVRTEHALSLALPDLSEEELAVWQMDQHMNWRGARFDVAMATSALKLADRFKKRLNASLEELTGIPSATRRQAVKDWLLEHEGLDLPDTSGDTIEWHLANVPLSERCRIVLRIVMDVNRTSTRKYQAALDRADEDGIVRDLLMYHGAGTGRWAGKGVQVHNFPARDLIVKDFDEAAELITSGDLEWCIAMYGDVMRLLSHSLRGMVVARPGRDLMTADYAAIEARCVLWEADAVKALELFRLGGDIYCDMATGIYGFQVIKGVHKDERQFGKQAVLGLGYGMGFVTFLLTCRKYDIHFSREQVARILGNERLLTLEAWVRGYLCLDAPPAEMTPEQAKKYSAKKRQAATVRRRLEDAREDVRSIVHELALMKHTTDVYRSRYPEVKEMWKLQEEAAIQAVQRRATFHDPVVCGKVKWYLSERREVHYDPQGVAGGVIVIPEGKWLHCELPSGRRISYCDPEVKLVKTSWGEPKPALRYMSVDGVTRKWLRTSTYGGKIVENITQAVARDIMANAMMLAYEGDTYETIMSVHDELICEVDKDKGSLKEFEELMSNVPHWAAGCPIAAEAERYERYRK